MIGRLCFAATLALILALAAPISSQQEKGANCPMHQKHEGDKSSATAKSGDASHTGRHAEMDKRGDQAMGFSQSKTTHHFLLRRDGGAIEVEARDPQDEASRDQIRQHLARIAQMFAEGNFDTPMFIHAQSPPGAAEMKRRRLEIKYEFEKTERGGRVSIRASSAEALEAVHEFLRFQIKEHRTGDPLEVN